MHSPAQYNCLFCKAPLTHVFADLGTCPPSNAFISKKQLNEPELFYPLRAYVCERCLLVQGPHYKRPQDIFTHDYAYYSSYSKSWVKHAKAYVNQVAGRFNLGSHSLVIEIGSNDGYLLQHALDIKIPCLGIDPSSGAASIAQARGIPTITTFFTKKLAGTLLKNGTKADLICGINVFAHVPDINDLVAGMAMLLKPEGVITMEFPHIMRLVDDVQFDTIYHEHYFYYSLDCVGKILTAHGLRLFDVEEFPTHGGSLRIYACKKNAGYASTGNVELLLKREIDAGLNKLDYYLGFQKKIDRIRFALMRFLMECKEKNRMTAAYGAAAKGNTLINYFGIQKDLIPYVVDASPIKQGKFMPGSHIPVVSEARIKATLPDYVFILPWNLKDEISSQLQYIRKWGGKFVTAIPELTIW